MEIRRQLHQRALSQVFIWIPEAFSVAGKKCIVTGAAQGLSRGMAEGLLENGAEVVLMDL